jgi:acyl carrier protein
MTNTLSTVKHILRREFFVPARKIRTRQVLTADVGLSAFELNALLYFIEEKYHVELAEIKSDTTVQELVDNIDHTLTTEIL